MVGVLIVREGSVGKVGFAYGQDPVILREIQDFKWNKLEFIGFSSVMELSFHGNADDQGFFSLVPSVGEPLGMEGDAAWVVVIGLVGLIIIGIMAVVAMLLKR